MVDVVELGPGGPRVERAELVRWLTYAGVGLADDALCARRAGDDGGAVLAADGARRACELARELSGQFLRA